MKIGFESSDWIPPIISYYDKFKNEEIELFLEKLDFKFAGDWITKQTPTKRKEAMNKILRAIEKSKSPEELLGNKELFEFDMELYINSIKGKVYRERFAKYLLLKLEYLFRENDIVHFSDYKNISIEHVLPQKPDEESKWKKHFTEEERLEWTHRLSNLVLLSRRKNSKLGNLDFEEKKNRYLNGRVDIFHMTKLFLDKASKWDTQLLNERQKILINKLINNR